MKMYVIDYMYLDGTKGNLDVLADDKEHAVDSFHNQFGYINKEGYMTDNDEEVPFIIDVVLDD